LLLLTLLPGALLLLAWQCPTAAGWSRQAQISRHQQQQQLMTAARSSLQWAPCVRQQHLHHLLYAHQSLLILLSLRGQLLYSSSSSSSQGALRALLLLPLA
jgi:hypothetical protein